jgi:hypothetical protein
MKRSSQPHKPAELSKSLHRRLDAYALGSFDCIGSGLCSKTCSIEYSVLGKHGDRRDVPRFFAQEETPSLGCSVRTRSRRPYPDRVSGFLLAGMPTPKLLLKNRQLVRNRRWAPPAGITCAMGCSPQLIEIYETCYPAVALPCTFLCQATCSTGPTR